MAKSYQHERKKREYAAIEIEKLKAEIQAKSRKEIGMDFFDGLTFVYEIIDERIKELKGEIE